MKEERTEKRASGQKGERVAFLDRDGTLNIEKGYLYKPEEFVFLPGAKEAVRRLNEAGYRVIIITNQAGVARGYYTEEDVKTLHQYINQLLQESGGHIDAFYYCPHHPEHGIGEYKKDCRCRKPQIGMFEEAEKMFKNGINKQESYMIGDKLLDVQAGHSYGVKSILVGTGYGTKIYKEQQDAGLIGTDGVPTDGSYDFFTKNLLEAVEKLLDEEKE